MCLGVIFFSVHMVINVNIIAYVVIAILFCESRY
jgi:hypothetical protein